MENPYFKDHIVNFYLCNYCEYKNTAETDEPCCDCLDYAGNSLSRHPVHFKDNGSLAKALKNNDE